MLEHYLSRLVPFGEHRLALPNRKLPLPGLHQFARLFHLFSDPLFEVALLDLSPATYTCAILGRLHRGPDSIEATTFWVIPFVSIVLSRHGPDSIGTW